jgi:UDP-galactopyranose mutase
VKILTSSETAPNSNLKVFSQDHTSDLVVFSHLRWDFVFQRPQHILTRMALKRRVFYFEEPVFTGQEKLEILERENGVKVVVPHLPVGLAEDKVEGHLRDLVDELFVEQSIDDFTAWYYTPMALPFTRHLYPTVTVYDCMDELSAFKNAPENLVSLESELLDRADVVFTGGRSLFEAKKHRHPNIHPFPSSIDTAHFRKARSEHIPIPADQGTISGTRVGFFGVLDERFDIELISEAAKLRPDWNFVLIGPVVKIDPATLPQAANIHYLGKKSYQELPHYLAGWDLAILPFARNESTRFISPTKTPEYLAAGRPVVSTSIRDVVDPYGKEGLVKIADRAEDFVRDGQLAITERMQEGWLEKVDDFLSRSSWDGTCLQMNELENKARKINLRHQIRNAHESTYKAGSSSAGYNIASALEA